jgi:hypothetical protein
VDSYEHFINLKRQKNIDNLQDQVQSPPQQTNPLDSREETIRKLIVMTCKYQKSYIRNSLDKLLDNSIENTETICKYIIAEQNDDLKLVAANLDDGLSDAVEVEMNQVEQSQSNSNILYEATITDNQEGPDLDTGETKTLNNVNGIVLWNDGEDEPIEFAENNFVEANINFFN